MVPIAHFSHGLRVGDEIHLGATAGTDANRRLAGSPPGLTDVRAQANQMFRNMKLALELLGGRMEDVVRIKNYLTDWRDFAGYDEAYRQHFRAPYPSNTTVGTGGPEAARCRQAHGDAGRPARLSRFRGRVQRDLAAALSGAHRLGCPAFASAAAGRNRIHRRAGVDRQGRLMPGVEAQAQAAWERIGALLSQAGMDATDVLRTNNWLTDWRCYRAFNAGYGAFVVPPYPPRATVIGSLLEPGALVQIEAIAHAEGRNATVLVR